MFFFKRWGGVQKERHGRELEGANLEPDACVHDGPLMLEITPTKRP